MCKVVIFIMRRLNVFWYKANFLQEDYTQSRRYSEAHSEPYQASKMEFFCENC